MLGWPWQIVLFSYNPSFPSCCCYDYMTGVYLSTPLTLGMVWTCFGQWHVRSHDTNRSLKYACVVWLAFLLLPSALRIWHNSCWSHDEETHGTILNPTYNLESGKAQLVPAKFSRATSREWKISASLKLSHFYSYLLCGTAVIKGDWYNARARRWEAGTTVTGELPPGSPTAQL